MFQNLIWTSPPLEVLCQIFKNVTYRELVSVFKKLPQYISELVTCVEEIDFTEGKYLIDRSYKIESDPEDQTCLHPSLVVDTLEKFYKVNKYYAMVSDYYYDETDDKLIGMINQLITDPRAKELLLDLYRPTHHSRFVKSLYKGLIARLEKYGTDFILIIIHQTLRFLYVKGVVSLGFPENVVNDEDEDDFTDEMEQDIIDNLRKILVDDYPWAVKASLNLNPYIPSMKTYAQKYTKIPDTAEFSEIYYIGNDPVSGRLKYIQIQDDKGSSKIKIFKFPHRSI